MAVLGGADTDGNVTTDSGCWPDFCDGREGCSGPNMYSSRVSRGLLAGLEGIRALLWVWIRRLFVG